jgi:S-adenosyl-L-methionine hydrolase (adenosine-forming)
MAVMVTLTTDFGTADGYVGAMKGVLYSRAPGVAVVDISHDIPRHDIAAGAYALATAAPWFPPGTIHVAVVDPGVGSARRGVVIASGGQLFVGPDNGLFALVAPQPDAVREIAVRFLTGRVSPTFHGRDVFAVTAARLATGVDLMEVGPVVAMSTPPARGWHRVVHVDRFGNLITDVPGEGVAVVRVAGREAALRRTYADVAPGELVAYVGSGGTVEIAVRDGSAAEVLGATSA